MNRQKNIDNVSTISNEFAALKEEIEQYYSALPMDQFIGRSSAEWQDFQVLGHLVKYVETIAIGVALDKQSIRQRWGASDRASGSFDEIHLRYETALAEGAKSPEPYVPSPVIPEDITSYRSDLLSRWRVANEKILFHLKDWTEAEIDGCCVMHPLLGKITMREMLFCAICHNQGHIETEYKSK